jgi:creatinine amidohydrolase
MAASCRSRLPAAAPRQPCAALGRALSRARVLALSALMLLAVLSGHSAAAVPDSVFLEDLTWTELREAIAGGARLVIVPVGGTEQSGPYIALGKHNARVRVLAEKIARGLGHALVAPVIAYVPEGSAEQGTGHMRLPGTLSVPEPVFEQTLEAAGRSLRRHGFDTIVLIGDHGGYQASLRRAAARLNREWPRGTGRAIALDAYYQASSQGYARLLQDRGISAAQAGTHAGLADTSLQLATAPGQVRLQALRAAPPPGAADGVYGGDPRAASATLGEPGVALIVARSIGALKQVLAQP